MTYEAEYNLDTDLPKDIEITPSSVVSRLSMTTIDPNPILPSRKHNHYFKDVSKLQVVDVYRVIDLFEVKDPCIQHALKKLLVSGGRGVKDIDRDVQEAIDTLQRFQEMRKENAHAATGGA